MATKILIIGACRQIGTELTHKLHEIYDLKLKGGQPVAVRYFKLANY